MGWDVHGCQLKKREGAFLFYLGFEQEAPHILHRVLYVEVSREKPKKREEKILLAHTTVRVVSGKEK